MSEADGGGDVLVIKGFTEADDQDLIFGGERLVIEHRDSQDHSETIKFEFHIDWAGLNMTEDQNSSRHIFIELDDSDNDVMVTDLLPAGVDPTDYQNYDEIEVHGRDGNDTIDARGVTIRQQILGGEGNDIIHAVSALNYNDTDQTQVSDGPGNDIVYSHATGSGVGADIIVGSGDDEYRSGINLLVVSV